MIKLNKKITTVLSLLTVTFTSVSILVSCGETYDENYGYKIEENVDYENVSIEDDNYRNYYEIFVRSFADSDGDRIGDINGVTEKLDYIQDMGYSGIWLMPINESPSYHKYDVKDYYKIDPSYGTMDDLKNLLNEAHKRDIKVILDLVINHSSNQNELFLKSINAFEKYLNGDTLTEEEDKYKDYYSLFESKDDPNAKGKILYQAPGKSFYYEGNFSSEMPELNLDSKYVKEDLEKLVKFYLDLGVDGFRLDAVLYYFVKETAKNIEFLSWFKDLVKGIKEDAYIVGEAWTNTTTISNYYDSGIDSFFYFEGSTSYSDSFYMNSMNLDGILGKTYFDGLEDLLKTSEGGIPAPFLDNHDMSRYSRSSSKELNKYFYGLLAMSNGTTFTYYGSEIGMTGTVKPDQNVRIPILWGEENEKYDTSRIAGTSGKIDYVFGTVKENINDPNSILNYQKKANYLRNTFKEIARGEISLKSFDKDKGILIITKSYNGNSIDILFNFKETQAANLKAGELGNKDIVGQLVVDNTKYIGKLKDGTYIFPPFSISILK